MQSTPLLLLLPGPLRPGVVAPNKGNIYGLNPGGVCSGNRRPRVALSVRLWKICDKQGVFPGRTWDPSLNQIPKYRVER